MPNQNNPPWMRDELILTLSVFFRINAKEINPPINSPDVISLSKLLNELNSFEAKRSATYRNENGVKMKLMNFRSLARPGSGLANMGKQDRDIYDEFIDRQDILHELAAKIQNTIESGIDLSVISDDVDDFSYAFEGKVLTKLHRYKERDQKLVKRKKSSVLRITGSLRCEVCNFCFEEMYGEVGKGYIECHHITPLYLLEPLTKTKLSDLALVCANCHRMLHRRMSDGDEISIDYLKNAIEQS